GPATGRPPPSAAGGMAEPLGATAAADLRPAVGSRAGHPAHRSGGRRPPPRTRLARIRQRRSAGGPPIGATPEPRPATGGPAVAHGDTGAGHSPGRRGGTGGAADPGGDPRPGADTGGVARTAVVGGGTPARRVVRQPLVLPAVQFPGADV